MIILHIFRLRFNVDPSGMGFDLVNTIPITIGTLPLRNVWQNVPNYPPPTVPEGRYSFDRIKIHVILHLFLTE